MTDQGQVFDQALDHPGEFRPGGPFVVQMLFSAPVLMPERERMAAVMSAHVGSVDCHSHDDKSAGFAALEHVAQFEDGGVPVQLMVTGCSEFDGQSVGDFERSQMWNCPDADRILDECRYQVLATDVLAGGLPSAERAELDMDFLDALAELFPTCEAFLIPSAGKLHCADDVRDHGLDGLDRFVRLAVNARFFHIADTNNMLVDTIGMGTLCLPDLQYHFHGVDPNLVVGHAYAIASYLLQTDGAIEDGDVVDGISADGLSQDVEWACQYEASLARPQRPVLDVNMGINAAGTR